MGAFKNQGPKYRPASSRAPIKRTPGKKDPELLETVTRRYLGYFGAGVLEKGVWEPFGLRSFVTVTFFIPHSPAEPAGFAPPRAHAVSGFRTFQFQLCCIRTGYLTLNGP